MSNVDNVHEAYELNSSSKFNYMIKKMASSVDILKLIWNYNSAIVNDCKIICYNMLLSSA